MRGYSECEAACWDYGADSAPFYSCLDACERGEPIVRPTFVVARPDKGNRTGNRERLVK
ncbi:hypothetical protein GCM10007108_09210 [Thermogymnomonas acidicola]|uniref:Uncharacterized protein n=1 Tax=Thermogymnomonas acidicola TaxID=399579 RepID=A0AA37BRA5_9ARCH|nr:hypothetical protein GCM10007108_09210 [Thermogymnomonas acidicola]